jgi:hypothetical protein
MALFCRKCGEEIGPIDLQVHNSLCYNCFREQKKTEEHRERLEELREEEVEYQRQAARDAEIAREEAEEARRIAGLTTFTCCHCQGTFNEERGYSAIESPIGKPVCNKCYDLLKKCTECNQYF